MGARGDSYSRAVIDDSPTIGIDVGATKVTAGVVTSDGRIAERFSRRLTPSSNSSGLVEPLTEAIIALRTRVPEARRIGVGIAGLVNWPEGDIGYAANHGHRGLKLRRRLQAASGLPVVVDNDANAAAMAEARAGRFIGESVLFLAVGTGIGSGFVVDGDVLRPHRGRGAELGHIVVEQGSEQECTCGLHGCLEALASGRALVAEGRRLVDADNRGALATLVRRSGHAVTMSLMIDAALAGDPDVVRLVHRMGSVLGRTIAVNVMSLLPVDRVVVGGGLSALSGLLLDPMREAARGALAASKFQHAPQISLATHGQGATLVGAGLLAHDLPVGAPSPVLAPC